MGFIKKEYNFFGTRREAFQTRDDFVEGKRAEEKARIEDSRGLVYFRGDFISGPEGNYQLDITSKPGSSLTNETSWSFILSSSDMTERSLEILMESIRDKTKKMLQTERVVV